MPVRPLEVSDVPQVADLYWKDLRKRKGPTPAIVPSFLRELYFENPWFDRAIPSLVEEHRGLIRGFLGVVPRRMRVNGEPIRIAFGGNFVVHSDFRSSLAGLHLLRTYMAGPQDSSQTDSANDTSRALLERLGFTTIVPCSVHWIHLLRPAEFFTYALSHINESTWTNALRFAAQPLCSVADRIAARSFASSRGTACSRLTAGELSTQALLHCLAEFPGRGPVFADYDEASLGWLLAFMERMHGHGREMRKVLLRDENGEIAGWYLYSLTPGEVAEVVQIGATRKRIGLVLEYLFEEASSRGAIAVHGTLDRRFMDIFSEKNCFFTCRGGWSLAHSRKSGFLEILCSGDGFLSRLDGEWCLALGE